MPKTSSETQCAARMKKIEGGLFPVDKPFYEVADVALRYGVHEKTVYAGIKAGNPMYPIPVSRRPGTSSRIFILMDEIEACDNQRIQFYRTTRSWLELGDRARQKKFVLRAARDVLGPPKALEMRAGQEVGMD